MANIAITKVRTTDEHGKAKSTFAWEDAMVVEVAVKRAASLSDWPLEVFVQIVNLRGDPRDIGPWRLADGAVLPSIDRTLRWAGPGTSLVFAVGWNHYHEMMSGIGGGDQGGVFAVRATVRAIGSQDFAVSAPFAAAYQFDGYPPPAPARRPSGGRGSGDGGSGNDGGNRPGDSGGIGRGPVPPVRTRFGFARVTSPAAAPTRSSRSSKPSRSRG